MDGGGLGIFKEAMLIVEFSNSPETPKPCRSAVCPARARGKNQENRIQDSGKKHPGIAIRS